MLAVVAAAHKRGAPLSFSKEVRVRAGAREEDRAVIQMVYEQKIPTDVAFSVV